MGLSNHHRALVSNLGDGNWGARSGGEENKLDDANTTIYFPPALDASGAQDKGTEPLPGTDTMSPAGDALQFTAWTTKSNWIVQVDATNLGTGGSPRVNVYAVRPTGVQEIVLTVASTGEDSYGGYASEKICGPVAYFKFDATATTTTNLDVDCFVIGWNEGDISNGLADRS